MKTIEERAIDYASHSYIEDGNINTYIDESEKQSYIQGATEQKDIDINMACNIFCYTGCPHKIDSYDCLKDKCDTWKIFRRMMEE